MGSHWGLVYPGVPLGAGLSWGPSGGWSVPGGPSGSWSILRGPSGSLFPGFGPWCILPTWGHCEGNIPTGWCPLHREAGEGLGAGQ